LILKFSRIIVGLPGSGISDRRTHDFQLFNQIEQVYFRK